MRTNMKQAKKPWARRGLYQLLPVLALALLLLSLPALAAAEFSLPELGLSLSLPDSVDVFTRSMSPDDPLLKLKGQSAGQVRAELEARGLSLLARDIAGAYEIQLSATPDQGTDFSELDEAQIGEIAAEYGAVQFEILGARQAAFLLVKSGGEAVCATRVRNQLITLRLIPSSGFDEGMMRTLRGIAQSMDFGLRQ